MVNVVYFTLCVFFITIENLKENFLKRVYLLLTSVFRRSLPYSNCIDTIPPIYVFLKTHYSRRKEIIFPDGLWKSSRQELTGEP